MYVIWFFILFSSFTLFSYAQDENKPVIKTDQTIPLSTQRSPAQQDRKQLVDFKSISPPWLEQHPTIKQKVEEIIEKKKEEITKDAESLFQEFPTTALLPYSLHVQELKLFEHDKQNIVSVKMALRIYTGGAHGNKLYYSWNWDRQKNQFLSLDEVLSQEQFANLVEHVQQNLIEQRKKNDDEEIQAQIEAGASTREDFKIWNFKKDGIEIVFPEYQVASFAEGSFEVFVSLNSL